MEKWQHFRFDSYNHNGLLIDKTSKCVFLSFIFRIHHQLWWNIVLCYHPPSCCMSYSYFLCFGTAILFFTLFLEVSILCCAPSTGKYIFRMGRKRGEPGIHCLQMLEKHRVTWLIIHAWSSVTVAVVKYTNWADRNPLKCENWSYGKFSHFVFFLSVRYSKLNARPRQYCCKPTTLFTEISSQLLIIGVLAIHSTI